jgi:glycosyltransferase involved in cell wall biosynthesis
LITAMGRLTYQKGFDLLLQAFKKIADAHPHWQLMILGEGALRKDLERQRDELGLTKRVRFSGLVDNPFPILQGSSLFVMASRYEGFPCALLEAMACGLPVVYTDCPSGPSEIIREGIDGLLVPNGDVAALGNAMDRLMSDAGERQRLAARAPEVLERFGSDKIISQWESLFVGILK